MSVLSCKHLWFVVLSQMNSTVQTVALCRASHSTTVSKATRLDCSVLILLAAFYQLSECDRTHGVKNFLKKTTIGQLGVTPGVTFESWLVIPFVLGLPAHSDDSEANQRPRSRSVQGSPQLSPMRSLAAEYDVDTPASQRENHHNKAHSRLGSCCCHSFYQIL